MITKDNLFEYIKKHINKSVVEIVSFNPISETIEIVYGTKNDVRNCVIRLSNYTNFLDEIGQ